MGWTWNCGWHQYQDDHASQVCRWWRTRQDNDQSSRAETKVLYWKRWTKMRQMSGKGGRQTQAEVGVLSSLTFWQQVFFRENVIDIQRVAVYISPMVDHFAKHLGMEPADWLAPFVSSIIESISLAAACDRLTHLSQWLATKGSITTTGNDQSPGMMWQPITGCS